MDGLQAAEVISRERLAPVILLTAYSDAPIVEQANRAGVLAYLTKPFRQQELQPTIEIAISRYRELVALEGALGGVQEQIETSRAIGRATRLLMEKHGLSDQEAYRRLQAQALSMQRSLREIAEAVVLIEETATASPGARRPRAARNSRP
jgi:response regulator NasT